MYVYICIYIYIYGTTTSAIASDTCHACWCLQEGGTALMGASDCGKLEVVAKLTEAGANLDLQSTVRESGVPCGQCWRSMCVCDCVLTLLIYIHIYIYVYKVSAEIS